MANTYDEKILSSFGKRTTEIEPGAESTPNKNGIFVVDPNKVINSDNNIIPRYVKQEDLVMYANLTARLNPDSAIVQDDANFQVITIGQIGVNFLNPLKEATKNNDGTINFAKKRNKGAFTTDWSDFFTTNTDQESFFDPETFGITSIDVTHNAGTTPIIKIEFVDVQGRTLLERGNDPTNPYNIFYRFPYPLFTLTLKGYYGKGIDYPLSMTKTSTTFDSSTGNYIIRAEFLSRTFSIYNNFLMVYAYLAPYMYEISDGDYLGKRLLRALYQKQNKKYEKKFGVTVGKDGVIVGKNEKAKNDFRKHQFTKYPSILDMIKTGTVLGRDDLAFAGELDKINADRGKALEKYSKLEDLFTGALRNSLPTWDKNLKKDIRTTNNYYLGSDLINRLNTSSLAGLSSSQMKTETFNPYKLIEDYSTEVATLAFTTELYTSVNNQQGVNFKENIILEVKDMINKMSDFTNKKSYIEKLNSSDLTTIFNDDLILFNNTSLRDTTSLSNVYFSDKFFREVHKIITNNLVNFFEKVESITEDELFFSLQEKVGFVPNVDNVIRILMNNMQVFLTMLNLSALNSFRQIKDDSTREHIQSLFGEYEVDDNTPNLKKFYPFPNYFKKELDTNSNQYVFKKTYPGNAQTQHWFEVQFVEEIFQALERMKKLSKTDIDSTSNEEINYIETIRNQKVTKTNNQIYGLISSLLVLNNLNVYDKQQTPIETVFEFVDKLMLFSGFANHSTEKINTKLIDLLATHEFATLENSISGADGTSLSVFYNNIKNKITPTSTAETPYDAFARTMAGDAANSTALVNNISNTLNDTVTLINKNYTIDEFNANKGKIESYVSSATNLDTFKTLYNYDPLEYKSRKNTTTPERLHALFFNGLETHSQFESNDPNLITLSSEIKANYKKTTKEVNGYVIYTYPQGLEFKIDNKVTTNKENSNALTISAKTESINPTLKSDKKIKDQTKYSKIYI